MPHYLFLDHGGVLDGEMTTSQPGAKDLVLSDLGDGIKNILKNGVEIVAQLNELVERYDFRIVFHSKNREEDQVRILRQLQQACIRENCLFPTVEAMAVYDPQQYPSISSSAPRMIMDRAHGVKVIGYGQEKPGKACVREALASALNIQTNEHHDHVVFDDGPEVIATAHQENYQVYLIGGSGQALSLFQAIADVYGIATQSSWSFTH